jgi:hypothetical protein
VRLEGDPHFTYLQAERAEPSYQEMYFKTLELNGRCIEVANFERNTALDYIKLVPVSRSTLPAPTGETIGILDFADDADVSELPLFEAGSAIRNHADAGFDIVLWKAYAVRCEYHTRVGEQRSVTYDDDAFPDATDQAHSEIGVGGLLKKYDTMRQAVDEAHKVGLKIYGHARINNEFARPNHQFSPDTAFHKANPDKFMDTRYGDKHCKLSFAHPAVRRHKIDILCEIAAYGMDGIAVDVLRHPPMVSYDLPLVEAFIEKTGQDPRRMENDGSEEWLRFRCEAFTQFLREARAALYEQAGKRFPLIVRTVDQEWRNLHIGCDVETWISEGLVDGIIFGPHVATAVNYPETMNLRPYIEMAQRASTPVKVWGQVWRYGSGIQAEVLAKDLYEQGVDGVTFYESNYAVFRPSLREQLWRFNRPECLRGF